MPAIDTDDCGVIENSSNLHLTDRRGHHGVSNDSQMGILFMLQNGAEHVRVNSRASWPRLGAGPLNAKALYRYRLKLIENFFLGSAQIEKASLLQSALFAIAQIGLVAKPFPDLNLHINNGDIDTQRARVLKAVRQSRTVVPIEECHCSIRKAQLWEQFFNPGKQKLILDGSVLGIASVEEDSAQINF
ncbi:hypothetical protein [Pseudomonas sp. o96-267]|uniref:hypothetical protein n=1 Tax=Pseudomonas sp. o96-267 TaxID=2479853 RepID=UPI000F7B792B|nr:hypothetical protein [Pseudomonas sp. o96-267]